MLATATEPYFYPNHATQQLEVHRRKISLTRAGAGYDYPTIRVPFAFSSLIGLSTRIYQTVHDGALAFLVVVSSTSKSNPNLCGNPFSSAEAPRLYTAKIESPNLSGPIVSFFNQGRDLSRMWRVVRTKSCFPSLLNSSDTITHMT
jgi:hypothetical protein